MMSPGFTRGGVQRVLDAPAGIDVKAPGLCVEGERLVLDRGSAAGPETGRDQQHEEGATRMPAHGSSITRIWLIATFFRVW